jgi:hypothetical protein
VRPHHRKMADPAHGSAVLSAGYLVKKLIGPEYRRPMNWPAERAATERAAHYLRHLGGGGSSSSVSPVKGDNHKRNCLIRLFENSE